MLTQPSSVFMPNIGRGKFSLQELWRATKFLLLMKIRPKQSLISTMALIGSSSDWGQTIDLDE